MIFMVVLQLAYIGVRLLSLATQEWNNPGCHSRNEVP